MRKIPLFLILVSACSPLTEDNAPERLAETVCRKTRSCDPDSYDDLYQSEFDECVDEQTRAYEFILDVGGIFGVDLNIDELRKCRRDIRSASCEDFLDGNIGNDCDDVLSF